MFRHRHRPPTGRTAGFSGFRAFFLLALLCATAVRAESAPERIVSLAPNMTEILFDLGAGDRIAAVTDFCNHPPEARQKRRIGGFANPSIEAILALAPDLVVMNEDGNPRHIAEKLARRNIPLFVFRARGLSDLPDEILRLGTILGREERTRRAVEAVRADLKRLRGAAHSIGWGEKRFLMIIQPEPLISAGPGTPIDDALAWLGLRNIVPPSASRYPRLSLEFVIRERPDILLFGQEHGSVQDQTARLLEKLRPLPAAASGRICRIGDGMYRLGPRVAAGLREVAACLARR